MKKIILCLLLVLSLLMISCEDEHKHEFTATVEKSPTCEDTGLVSMTCPCGEKYTQVIPATGHKELVEKEVTKATCTTPGKTNMVCPVCNKVFSSKDTAAKGHTPSKTAEVITPATCTADGSSITKCTVCNETISTDVIPATGHTEGIASIKKVATCTEKGEAEKVCTVCGVSLGVSEIPANGHTPGTESITKAATCTEDGLEETKCTVCGVATGSRVIPATGHTPGTESVTKAATCTEKGLEETKCTVCGVATGSREIAALGHTEETDKVLKAAATCTADGSYSLSCKRCHEEIGTETITKLGHDWSKTVIVKEATCSSKGEAKRTCQRCNKEDKGEIAMLAHSFTGETTVTTEATCTTEGTASTKCANCDAVTTSTLPALGHDFQDSGTWKNDNEGNPITPTAFTAGVKIYKCSRCDAQEEREVWEDSTKHVHKTMEDSSAFIDLNNTYGLNTDSTCSVSGKLYYYCNCWTDGNGNFSLTQVDSTYTRYPIGYTEKAKDDTKHSSTPVSETKNISSYFYGSVTESKCPDCNTVLSTTYNKEGKVSAAGRWAGNVNSQIDVGNVLDVYVKYDVSLYANGLSVCNSTMKIVNTTTNETIEGNYIDMALLMSNESLSSYPNLTRLTDGRFLSSSWGTGVNISSGKSMKFLNFESSTFNNFAVSICDEDTTSKILKSDMYMSTNVPDSLLVLTCQSLPDEKGVLRINGTTAFTDDSFSKDENLDVITIPSDTSSITLEWITLQGDAPSNYEWSVDGIKQSVSNSTLTISSSGTVSCTANGETHTAKFIFE